MDVVLIDEKNMKWFEQMVTEHERRLIAQDPEVFALGAVEEETACGILVCRYNELYLDILYLAVADEFRRRKVATRLVEMICDMAREQDIPVSCYFASSDCKDPIYLFFDSLESFMISEEEEIKSLSIPYSMLGDCKALNELKVPEQKEARFFELTGREQKAALQDLLKKGNYYLEDMETEKENYIPQLCFIHMEKGEVEAALFVEKADEPEDVVLSFAYSSQKGIRYLLEELREAREYVLEHMGSTGCVWIDAMNDEALRLIQKLYPDYLPSDTRLYVADWNMVD